VVGKRGENWKKGKTRKLMRGGKSTTASVHGQRAAWTSEEGKNMQKREEHSARGIRRKLGLGLPEREKTGRRDFKERRYGKTREGN